MAAHKTQVPGMDLLTQEKSPPAGMRRVRVAGAVAPSLPHPSSQKLPRTQAARVGLLTSKKPAHNFPKTKPGRARTSVVP
jgi:hypothetical protein